jgi:hypothetical protein
MSTRLYLGLLLAACAHASSFTAISQPDASYTSGTTLIPIVGLDESIVQSISDGTLTISFTNDSGGLVVNTVGDDWSTWGSPPNTESGTPRVLWTQGDFSVVMDFDAPLTTFGFEAEPDSLGAETLDAQFFSGSTQVGDISLNVDGNGGAMLFAATSDLPFTSLALSSPNDDFAAGQFRYALAAPEPGVGLLSGCALVGLFGPPLRRKLRRKTAVL